LHSGKITKKSVIKRDHPVYTYIKLVFKKHLTLLICEMCGRLEEEQEAMRLILAVHINTKQAYKKPPSPEKKKPAA
jgi:hypothetical protein